MRPPLLLHTPKRKHWTTHLNEVPIVVDEELADFRLSPVASPALHDEPGVVLDPGSDPGIRSIRLSGKKSVMGLRLKN